mmetsp:Transcript_21611/g.47290  ORF Transcript_21611/g.47290 Transcript_21611/m.47290 type:complete len:110 (-) Transcript_21611:127-456(-)
MGSWLAGHGLCPIALSSTSHHLSGSHGTKACEQLAIAQLHASLALSYRDTLGSATIRRRTASLPGPLLKLSSSSHVSTKVLPCMGITPYNLRVATPRSTYQYIHGCTTT